jgi:UDP-N-acetylglucosamine 4,6-dehydratase
VDALVDLQIRRAVSQMARKNRPISPYPFYKTAGIRVMKRIDAMDWTEKSVLVTGGTGSFGRKFVEVMLKEYSPRRIIIFSRDELKQHEMRTRGFDPASQPSIRFFIGDVRDLQRLRRAFQDVDIVVHAAALKQVPACEYNPIEAIMTNIMGARNVIEAALDMEVAQVVALSTDKAVNPVNLYGATKLAAEKLFVQSNAYGGGKGTQFSCVRYGNVIGSRGSVIPLFIQQRENGVITITDKRMTRFWLSIGEGVRFTIRMIEELRQSTEGAAPRYSGEVFVPKIPSMRIVDLAQAIAPEAKVEVIGIRPGEKLHEILVSQDEARHTVELEDRFVVEPTSASWERRSWMDRGTELEDGYTYTSENNPKWLGENELNQMIRELDVA